MPPTPTLTLAGQTLHLLPSRCAFWQETRTLLLADLHLGKAAHLRHHGLPVPEGHTAHDLDRLTEAIHQTQPHSLLICGDFFHASTAHAPAILQLLHAWRSVHSSLPVTLITGNHDLGSALPPVTAHIHLPGPRLHLPPFHFIHDPAHASPPQEGQITICGHLHPVALLAGTRPSLRAPCFWYQAEARTLILPAFGTFTAGVPIHPAPGDTLHAIHQDRVVPLPPRFCQMPAASAKA